MSFERYPLRVATLMSPIRNPVGLVLLLLLATSLGCRQAGPQRGEVAGQVTFEGEPLASGFIAFIPIEGTKGPTTGGPISKGTYGLSGQEGPCLGKHRVEITATRTTGRQVKAGSGADDPDALVDEVEMYIPPKYNSQSELTVSVAPGVNTFDFDLHADARSASR